MRKPLIKRFTLILLAIFFSGTAGCDKSSDERPGGVVKIDSGPMVLMGTFARIQVRSAGEQAGREALTAALERLARIDQLLSTYRTDSEISRVNRRAGQEPVKLSPETYRLLQRALEYSLLTDGAFDITITPLLRVWKQAEKENRYPGPAELSRAKENIGFRNLQLSGPDECTVSFGRVGMELNVNAIAKGYAVDQALTAMRRPGVAAAMVDIGGEIACFGRNEPGKDWLVGIQDPFARSNDDQFSQKVAWKVSLRDCGIATSGNYRQYVTINGKKYSHIIDPRTGKPAEKLPSVTVIAERALDADALATAVSILGPIEGMKLIESIPHTEAMLVGGTVGRPKIYRSTGFCTYPK